MDRGHAPNGHTLIVWKHFTGWYAGYLQRLIGAFSFSDHDSSKASEFFGKLLRLAGRQVGPSNQKSCIRPSIMFSLQSVCCCILFYVFIVSDAIVSALFSLCTEMMQQDGRSESMLTNDPDKEVSESIAGAERSPGFTISNTMCLVTAV